MKKYILRDRAHACTPDVVTTAIFGIGYFRLVLIISYFQASITIAYIICDLEAKNFESERTRLLRFFSYSNI